MTRQPAPSSATTHPQLPPAGSPAWERAGGPPLTFGQRLGVLGGAGVVILTHYGQMGLWQLSRRGLLPARAPRTVDLAAWQPPDTPTVRMAETYLRAVSTPQMVNHSLRTYWFSAILCDLRGHTPPIDREALYVAAVLHDVGLSQTDPPAAEHCFSVGSAREARRIMSQAGWDQARQDSVAVAITTNPNPTVPLHLYGPVAHFMLAGGLVEVLAQEWKIAPDNLAEVLRRYPRAGFAMDALQHVRHEMQRNPGCRFDCLNPLFPFMVRRSTFSLEALGR